MAISPLSSSSSLCLIRRVSVPLFLGLAISCLSLYFWAYPLRFFPAVSSSSPITKFSYPEVIDLELERVLKSASMANNTVILTTLNEAWAEAESIIDLFLESFTVGNKTDQLISHLVIISLDQKAHSRCLSLHPHCYFLNTTRQGLNFSGGKEAFFMTSTYLDMMWARIDFLATVLQMGYSFVFSDADVMWLQDPFPHFYEEADFQISCDRYIGDPFSRDNQPNGGFNYVKSNPKTVAFYKFWHWSRKFYPGLHDQDVLNKIKFDPFIKKIGLQMRFLDTAYFGGFCEPSKDFNLASTMHANCCVGLKNKIDDLRIVLRDWKRFMLIPQNLRASNSSSFSWNAPQKCR